eukprot:s514_g16.t1
MGRLDGGKVPADSLKEFFPCGGSVAAGALGSNSANLQFDWATVTFDEAFTLELGYYGVDPLKKLIDGVCLTCHRTNAQQPGKNWKPCHWDDCHADSEPNKLTETKTKERGVATREGFSLPGSLFFFSDLDGEFSFPNESSETTLFSPLP